MSKYDFLPFIGGVMIGTIFVLEWHFISWWTLLTLPIYILLGIYIIFSPWIVSEWVKTKRIHKRGEVE